MKCPTCGSKDTAVLEIRTRRGADTLCLEGDHLFNRTMAEEQQKELVEMFRERQATGLDSGEANWDDNEYNDNEDPYEGDDE